MTGHVSEDDANLPTPTKVTQQYDNTTLTDVCCRALKQYSERMKIQGTEGGRKSISPSCFLLVLAVLAQPTASTSTTGSPASSTIITVLSPATSLSSSATTPANSLSPTTQTTTTVTPGSASSSTDGLASVNTTTGSTSTGTSGSASTSSTNSVSTITSTPGSSTVSGTAPSAATSSSSTVQVISSGSNATDSTDSTTPTTSTAVGSGSTTAAGTSTAASVPGDSGSSSPSGPAAQPSTQNSPSTAQSTPSSTPSLVDCYHHQCSGLSLETLCLSDHISNTSISVPTCEAAYCKITLREKNFITTITSECADTTCQLQTTAETSAQPREVVNCCRTHLCNLDTFVEFSAAEIVGPRFLASLGMVLTATLLTI